VATENARYPKGFRAFLSILAFGFGRCGKTRFVLSFNPGAQARHQFQKLGGTVELVLCQALDLRVFSAAC
jgi:hypothetical protein